MKLFRDMSEVPTANLVQMLRNYGVGSFVTGFFMGLYIFILQGSIKKNDEIDYGLLLGYPVFLVALLAAEIYTRKKVFPEIEKRLKE